MHLILPCDWLPELAIKGLSRLALDCSITSAIKCTRTFWRQSCHGSQPSSNSPLLEGLFTSPIAFRLFIRRVHDSESSIKVLSPYKANLGEIFLWTTCAWKPGKTYILVMRSSGYESLIKHDVLCDWLAFNSWLYKNLNDKSIFRPVYIRESLLGPLWDICECHATAKAWKFKRVLFQLTKGPVELKML